MATLVLGAVGAAAGGSFGGSFLGLSGSVLGRAAGSLVGRALDQSIMGSGAEAVEVGRIDRLRLTGASEGSPIPRVMGRARVAGQIIWATRFQERSQTTEISNGGGGGKGGGQQTTTTQTSYYYTVSIAVCLCEGEIKRIGRVWADGNILPKSSLQMRVYKGTEGQRPDPLIEAVDGADNAPAFRGSAYVVIEDLDLSPYGSRVPQLSFEVMRDVEAEGEVPSPAQLVEGVALIPGTGEYSLSTTKVHYDFGGGSKQSANVNTPEAVTDFRVATDDLLEEFPNLKSASLIVSWFGDDLRCGECSVRPLVEQNRFDGAPQVWNVSGLERDEASVVPHTDGRPLYGGTPSDVSVVESIRHLNESGIDVTFYPFILMTQIQGNGLTDPYGAPEQPELPWRGRITTKVAAGVDGSTDRTSKASAEVSEFFGSTESQDFARQSIGSKTSSLSEIVRGPRNDWSYRRFILHYAHLCAAAGGVEAFCIGSEMRGLTRIRDANDRFPAVEAFRDLAADVRAILPNTKISYAADWSEYASYSPSDTGNLHFHLDPLWGDENIDFVGIDNYMPIADWRDGAEHADIDHETTNSLGYLQENIEGGEGYDWYYASVAAREAQHRSPILDGAHGEPWVFRYKDITNWWGNLHYDRIDGSKSGQSSDWLPESKPIRFTEYGCAAIDKGANQPNKFIDEKSSESSLPYFSSGRRDDTMQMQYLRAILDYWADKRKNPVSTQYNGRMLDLSHSLGWAWDARPWPYFPELSSLWSDSINYRRGHWLSGRSSNQPLATVIKALCLRSGLTYIDVSRVVGIVRGYAIHEIQSARGDLQPLMLAHGVEASEEGGVLVFSMRATAPEFDLDSSTLVRSEGKTVERQRSSAIELPEKVGISHVDAEGDYEVRVAEALSAQVSASSTSETEIPLVLTRGEAHALAERYLIEASIVRDTIEFSLAPSRRSVAAGAIVTLDNGPDRWRIDRIEEGQMRAVEAIRMDRSVFEPSDLIEDGFDRVAPLVPVPVDVTFLDLPRLSEDSVVHAPYIAIGAEPWTGPVAIYSSVEDNSYRLNTLAQEKSRIGVTETNLLPAQAGVIDNGPDLYARFTFGDLESVSLTALLSGANAAAINDGTSTGWEIFQYRDARLVAPNVWALSGRLRGQRGTEWASQTIHPTGSQIVLLDASLQQIDLPQEAIGLPRHYRSGPASLSLDDETYVHHVVTATGEGTKPLAPVHLRARWVEDGLYLSWIRRTREMVDGWGVVDVPLGESAETYMVKAFGLNFEVLLELQTTTPYVTIAAQNIAKGQVASVEVAQLSDIYGPGTSASVEVS